LRGTLFVRLAPSSPSRFKSAHGSADRRRPASHVDAAGALSSPEPVGTLASARALKSLRHGTRRVVSWPRWGRRTARSRWRKQWAIRRRRSSRRSR